MRERDWNGRSRLVWAAALLLLVPAIAPAQGVPQHVRVRLDAAADALPPINLRPNTTTAVHVVLQNPTPDDFRNFTVKLVQVLEDEVRVVAQAEVAKLLPREEIRVAFLPKAVKAKDGSVAALALELAGPPFKLQLWIEPKLKGDFPPVKRDLDVLIREPRDYLTAQARYDAAGSKLSFRLTLDGREKLIGPPVCPVELVLGPQLLPGKNGAFKQVLVGPKGAVELHASGVTFVGPAVREGYVSLTVDGYSRAFVYPVRLRGSGELNEADIGKKVAVRLLVPAYARPATKFPVRVELDGPTDGDYRVEVALDRAGTRELFNQVAVLPGLRQQKARITVSPAGALVCQTDVRDWQLEFDTAGVFGKMWLRVAVFKKGRQVGKDEEIELIYPTYLGPDVAILEADAESKRVFARVVQDDTVPEGIEFIDLPREWPIKKPLVLKVRAAPRGSEQAPYDTALLLRGKVPPDGKFSPDAVIAPLAFDPKLGYWQATLAPHEKVEPLELSVRMTTRTGVPASRSVTVAFIDPTAGGKGIARIAGKISYGTNPVPKAAVVLADEKGAVKSNAKSGPAGEYVFDKVPPGNYLIAAAQDYPALVGQTKVTVPEGVELVDNVNVRLLSK